MGYSVKQVFDEACAHVKIDRQFVKDIKTLRLNFFNKNDDHINFFTGNLLGVHPIRYTQVDRERWFTEILEIDEADIKPLIRQIESIDSSWVRANDGVNLSCIWLVNQIFYEKSLSQRDKKEAMENVILMLQYKFLSSIMAHFFPYPADPSVAKATYEALSRKFEIKQFGSWQALLEHRTQAILDPRGIHYKTYSSMGDDGAVVNMISDIQDRLRNIVKKQRAVFQKVKEDNLRISSTTYMVEMDTGLELVDQLREQTAYVEYVQSIISDRATFIRQELMNVIMDIITTLPENAFYEVLLYSSDNYGVRGDRRIDQLIQETLLHAFSYISENQGIMSHSTDLSELIVRLKNLYMSSRMSDPQLIKMRDLSEKITQKAIRSKNSAVVSSTRTGLQVYIVLRAFSKNYYQG